MTAERKRNVSFLVVALEPFSARAMAATTQPRDLSVIGAVKMEEKSELQQAKKDESGEAKDDVNRGAVAAADEIAPVAAPSGEEGELNAYELERERNIARNRARMEAVVGESRRGLAAMKRATTTTAKVSSSRRPRRRPPPSPSSSSPPRRVIPTRASRRLNRSSRSSPSPGPANRTPPDCRASGAVSRSAKPVVPARFVRGVPSGRGLSDDAEALRQLNSFRASYMSRTALFNRVMAVSNLLKLEDFAAVLEEEGQRDLAALAREKLALMKRGNPAAVKEFVLRSKEREYERREKEAEEAEDE